MPQWYADLAAALAVHGLVPRGAFHPAPGDGVPGAAGTLVLVGNAGPAMWRAFRAGVGDGANPLDDWSRRVVAATARQFRADALFPFDGPPHLPFQRWAQRAEPVHASPLGILIHPEYGLWHGYRGALAFADRRALPARDDRPAPCAECAAKPCLSACPVAAFARGGYDVAACAGFLASAEGADCMAHSCRARRACPVGRDYAYGDDQAGFHMAAFLRARAAGGSAA